MASAVPSRILIIGATGNIGVHVTRAILAAKPRIGQQVSILTSAATASSPDKEPLLSQWKAKGLSVFTGDVTNAADVRKAYKDGNIDTVVSCLGRGALQYQSELLRLAEESQTVQWFFPSEYGTDVEYDETSKNEKPHQFKLVTRKFIRENLNRVKCTYIVTGPYPEMFLDYTRGAEAAGGFDPASKRATLIGDGEQKIGFTSMPDVGKLVAAALQHPEASTGKILKVQSFVASAKDILEEFEKQTGDKWAVEYTPFPKLIELEGQSWDEGKPYSAGFTLRRIWASGKTLYAETDNVKLGLQPSDMQSLATIVGEKLGKA